jgi:subtilisin family serine protease
MRSGTRLAALCGLLVAGSLAHAQIRLPQVTLPPLPAPGLAPLPTLADVDRVVEPVRSSVRLRARALLQRYPRQVERDPRGHPVVRAVILALSPDAQALQRALARGYEIQRDDTLPQVGERVVTLVVPRDLGTQRALRELRAADPGGSYDFDHLFVESAAANGAAADRPGADAEASPASFVDVRVGLIDGGIDVEHPVFAQRRPEVSGCGGAGLPSAHGTAVASLFVGASTRFHGAAPGAQLVAIDVYCGRDAPGGRVRDIVVGLASLASSGVRVINLSIVGPDNAVLAAVVRKVQAQSILLVAATGNDGPNAAPLYPAAYPGVVAVTAVDARDRVLMEACGGEHVRFAAPGADMLAAAPGARFAPVRGTSYASPLVAGLLARLIAHERTAAVDEVVRQLATSADHRGRPGRDPRYGFGVVGRDLPIEPARFDARAAAP